MALLHYSPTQLNAINMQKPRRLDADADRTHKRRIWKSVWDLALMFGKKTTIHGMNRLLGESSGHYERIIWFLTVVFAFFGSVYVCMLLSRRFNEGKFQTVVDSTRMPVYRIYFPVVSICNLNHLNWARIDEAKKRFLPSEKSPEKLRLFERILGNYDDIRFANFETFESLAHEPLESLNHVNFSLVVDFMTWRCEEMLLNCVWRHTKVDCCKIFSKRRTKSGPCWAFNTLETEEGKQKRLVDPMWPWRTGGSGPTSALQVKVLINPEKHFPNRTNDKGLSVMITEPLVWHKDPFRVSENTETMIEIEPVIYFYDNDTRSVSSDQRQCVFEDERSSSDFKSLYNYVYMIENCQSECHQEYLMRYCNCTVDLFFPPGQYPSCKAKDLPCLARNNDFFLYSHQPGEEKFVRSTHEGMICKCFRSCYSLNYIPDVRSSFLPPNVRGNISYVDLDVHFRFETMIVYRTSLVFGWVDLMVAFGGIVGLFLGCSLISAMELAYFALIEMPSFVIQRVRCSRKRRPDQAHAVNDSRQTEHHENSYHKFGGNSQRHFANGRNQFEEFVIKNNTIKAPPYTTLPPGQLLTWQRSGLNNAMKSSKNGFDVYY